jgi:hypothetical protein
MAIIPHKRCFCDQDSDILKLKYLNDLIRDVELTKSNAELLMSRLKQWNLLDESVQVTDQKKRHQAFSSFYTRQDGLCFCHNVTGLFEAIGIACKPNE